ncbi:KdsC family phosphatase [Roseimaritima ulvae]|uniref:3-deoxy-D-manno-octulosonate 8-phosphate phosphatase KdsC n=1 Tax=Roseimaritima ulvae TaxID=980254 RepID=A0A5B9QWF2_9BACT|nr:HAD hydrolase family protein [Roseimaritima ulvae]QEG42229.1 3-deoxy-D-manno-octulosonate 8-phosphate phosphatase KdsC [Roseimaritima ulvae]
MTKSVLVSDEKLAAGIQFILSDVDGVLTNGQIIYDNSGVETKAFHVRDGLGIKLWQRAGLAFGILTSRNSQIVRIRAAELGIQTVRQGIESKWPAAAEMIAALKLTPEQTCYIGDDLPDLPVLQRVGLPVAVADACQDVRENATWTTRAAGGHGAVREVIERLLRAQDRWEEVASVGKVS